MTQKYNGPKLTKEEFQLQKQERTNAWAANRERVLQEREAKREAKRQEKLFAEQQAQNDQFTSNSQVEAVNLQSDVDRQEATSNTKKAETQDQIQQNNEQVTTGESSVDGATNTSTGSPQDKIPQVNPLHDYAPYNYIITLSCIDKNTFNQGSSDEGIVIVKSGGKGVTGAPPLDKDFYIDNLVLRNSVSPTLQSGTGSTFQILFEVTEPYGTSFVDALIQAADIQGYTNHTQAVYLLKVEFKGISDDGKPTNTIPYTTRIVPISIIDIVLNIEAGVSTYAVTGRPVTNLAFTDLHGKTKEAYTIGGDTVEEVLNNFFEAITRTQATLKDLNKIKEQDKYELSTDECKPIIKTKIGYDAKSQSKNVVNYSYIYDTATHKTFYRGIVVPKGTNIQAFIEAIIRESDFYKDQFDDDMNPKGDKLQIARIYPRLEILDDDNGNNRPAYKFKYIVRTQEVTSAYFSKNADDLTKDLVSVRTYDYLYTGKNQDVLNFDITYKFAYYQAIHRDSNIGNEEQTDNYDGKEEQTNDPDQKGASGKGVSQVTVEPEDPKHKDGLQIAVNKKNGEIGGIFEQVIADPSGDLIVCTLEILGDPFWIAQKDVSNRSFRLSHQEGVINTDENGAVATDESEIYIDLNFRTPQDLDDKTGLFLNKERVTFSGKYKVFICANRFSGGVFTNELEMTRLKFQEDDEPQTGAGTGEGSPTGINRPGYSTRPANLSSLQSDTGDVQVDADNTGSNVTKVPVGSNISRKFKTPGAGGFDPGGFDFTGLPIPKISIDTGGYYYSDQQLQFLRDVGIPPDPSRIRNGN